MHTFMSSTTCFQKTSNNRTFSGTPLNLRTGVPSLSLPFNSVLGLLGDSEMEDFSGSVGVDDSTVGEVAVAQALDSAAGDVGDDTWWAPFCLALDFCSFTFSARRLAAASSCRLVSSGSSFSASRAAYAASRSIRAMTICLILTLGWSCAVAERKGPRVWRWNSSVKT